MRDGSSSMNGVHMYPTHGKIKLKFHAFKTKTSVRLNLAVMKLWSRPINAAYCNQPSNVVNDECMVHVRISQTADLAARATDLY